ncbi:unnamed protein product [Amaranthus hypochondriacus]
MSMNLDEFLKNAWSPEINQTTSIEENNNGSSTKLLQSLGSLPFSRTSSEKIVDEMWRELKQGEKIKTSKEVKREPMTLESFLTKAGAIDESSLGGPVMSMDVAPTSQAFSQPTGSGLGLDLGLSPDPTIGASCDRLNSVGGSTDKRMKRKIKNRESAARSRARKQAYHNELVSEVSLLEERNMRYKKEKEFDSICAAVSSDEPRYQLRRTSSSDF